MYTFRFSDRNIAVNCTLRESSDCANLTEDDIYNILEAFFSLDRNIISNNERQYNAVVKITYGIEDALDEIDFRNAGYFDTHSEDIKTVKKYFNKLCNKHSLGKTKDLDNGGTLYYFDSNASFYILGDEIWHIDCGTISHN